MSNTDTDRKSYIGSSDAAAILVLSPWRTPLHVYAEKIGDAPEPRPDPARDRRLARGKKMEAYILDRIEEEYQIEVVSRNTRHVDATHPFLRCEIDFEWQDGINLHNGEVKSIDRFAARHWGDPDSEDVPVWYAAQVAHAQMVTGRGDTAVFALFGLDDLVRYWVPRDEDIITALREAEVRFWHDHVLKRVPPPPKTNEDLMWLFAERNAKPANLNHEYAEKVARLKALRKSITECEKEEGALALEIKLEIARQWGIGMPDAVTDDAVLLGPTGEKLGTWKRQTSRRLDITSIKRDLPDVAAEYTVDSHTRVLRIARSIGD